METREKKNIVNMTFDSMNMSEKRSEEIINELIKYNRSEKNMESKEFINNINKCKNNGKREISVYHEISPDNNKNSKWKRVTVGCAVLAAVALGVFIWCNAYINNKNPEKTYMAGSNTEEQCETTEKTIGGENNEDKLSNTVFVIEEEGKVSSVSIDAIDTENLMYDIEQDNISVTVMADYNYNIYSRETDKGLELLAVGIRKERNTYYYVYSKQLNNDKDNISFLERSFSLEKKYTDDRDSIIDGLSEFYEEVNEFISNSQLEMSFNQENIEGELHKEVFEYQFLEEAESAYVTCGIKDPISSRLKDYFRYIDGKIGQ